MDNMKPLSQLKKITEQRNKLMVKINRLDSQIDSILEGIQTKKVVEKQDHPKPGSGPAKLCKVMSSKPKTKEEIAKISGLSVGTVSLYLHQYHCFKSAGRGKGYIYIKSKGEKK